MVDDLIGAIRLALDLVPIVPAKRNIALPNHIPLENLEFSVTLDALLGFTVDFVDEPIRPWEAEHNPLFQAISCNPSNSMKVIDIICRTRDAVMQLELSDKTKTNYIYCGYGSLQSIFGLLEQKHI